MTKRSHQHSLIVELHPPSGNSTDNGAHRFGDQLTVEAWVRADDAHAECLQAVVSKWQPRDDLNAFEAFDAGHTEGLVSQGYFGAVFDGRYVYFAPQLQPHGQHGVALRYDTHGGFKDPASYQAFDASRVDGLDTRGYYGAVFDGRHVYYIPRKREMTDSNLLRFDTHGAFDDPDAWSAYNFGVGQTFQSGAFDGQYVYLCPGYRERDGGEGNRSGRVVRYNTRGDFKDPASYELFDAEHVDGLSVGNFDGGAFDGRYIYFVPLTNGVALRCDVRAGYTEASNWQAFDAKPLGMGMCVGAVFDGRYLYYVPYENGVQVRLDTHGDFRDPASWSRYDAGRTGGLDTRGFDGGGFDGRYIHFVPFLNNNETFHSNWLRYDPQKPFDDPSAWQARDVGHTEGLKTKGYNGGAFDGRFFYAAPWRGEWGEAGSLAGWDIHGRVLRYDSLGTDGTFSLLHCGYGHNGGLCGAVPGPAFLVNTARGVLSIAAHRALPPGRHHLAGVYDGKSLKLYLDGALVAQRGGSGRVQSNEVPIVVGRVNRGLGHFRGVVERVRVFNVARTDAEVRSAHQTL